MVETIEIRGLQEAIDACNGEIARKASVRSVNEITDLARTQCRQQIQENYNIKTTPINKALRTVKLSQTGGGTAKISVRGEEELVRGMEMVNRFLLSDFLGTRVLKGGVSFQIKKTGPRTLFRWSFGATMQSGHFGIFERSYRIENLHAPVGRRIQTWNKSLSLKKFKLPIFQPVAMGAASMFDQERIYAAVQKLVDEKYDFYYKRNYRFYAGA